MERRVDERRERERERGGNEKVDGVGESGRIEAIDDAGNGETEIIAGTNDSIGREEEGTIGEGVANEIGTMERIGSIENGGELVETRGRREE